MVRSTGGAPVRSALVEPEETEMAQVDVDLALDAIEQELADVELALERLGEGTYGRCETCGLVLSEAELESAPANRFCRTHLPLPLP
jgi:RNA polymerase-binding transcription factor DksA